MEKRMTSRAKGEKIREFIPTAFANLNNMMKINREGRVAGRDSAAIASLP